MSSNTRDIQRNSASRTSVPFTLLPGDLIRLVNSSRETCEQNLRTLGGVQGVAKALNVDLACGIHSEDISDHERREQIFGKNYIPPPKTYGILELMWEAFKDITIIVLAVSGAISVVLSSTVGDHKDTGWIEGTCILGTVFIVTLVAALNDYQKERQFQALNAVKEDEKIKVIRDGEPTEVGKFNLLVGDIVRIDLGDILPADGIVFHEKELKIDESAMTGESDLLTKNEANPYLFSGTKVMEGFGRMLVVCVGANSQSGIIKTLITGNDTTPAAPLDSPTDTQDAYVQIQTPGADASLHKTPAGDSRNDIKDEKEFQSPLEAKLYKLTILIGKLGTVIALFVFIIMSVRMSVEKFAIDGEKWRSKYVSDYLNFFITAITVLVVAIPEGLPLAVTIALAFSVKKMLADNNLVRHLDACETMGSATTICSDKTGTLTTNRMTVMQIWIGGQEFSSGQSVTEAIGKLLQEVFYDGICINSTAELLKSKIPNAPMEHTGNKTECALLHFVGECGIQYADIRANAIIAHMLTFSSQKKRMSVVVQLSESKARVYTKGATEVVLDLCENLIQMDGSVIPLESVEKEGIKDRILEKYASQGYRTLCLAYRDINASASELEKWSDDDLEKDLTCVAIVGIEDPVRSEVPDAIRDCKKAGIVVRMVTGDNITTARSIAAKCGIIQPGDGSLIMEGSVFRSRVLDAKGTLCQSEFDLIWPKLRVLARSSPKDKHTLVSGLMQTTLMPYGPQVVAVTGDGTNDAPALKKANVGFAMGISGTAVAKDASDIILMDDNFTSIVSAIKWGRNVYDSIAKFLQFQLTVNLVAIVLALIGAIFIEQSPLTAVQMLWVNLIMDSFASLSLATEPPTPALLTRSPYPKTKPLLSKKMIKHIIGQSIYQLIILLTLTFSGETIFDLPSGRRTDLPEDQKNDPNTHLTIIFNTFVWMQLFNELNCRKIHDEVNIFDGITKNRFFIYLAVLQVVMQIVLVEWTGRFFNTVSLSAVQWLACVVLGCLSLPIGLALRCVPDRFFPAICQEPDAVAILDSPMAHGQELWLRGFCRIRAQLRVVKAFQKGVAARAMIGDDRLYARKNSKQ
uniref:Calcium-transporting ATPase n=1 Tax=Albugo laibachii Nc14 TaxID=890382 RepID=F0W1Q6_9STRA|nr:plasma membrane calcium ATPase putative [Albugo laibachii Nc14]|eukprot:CCA14985.1 plasma membrane calcium ATPase putative [Albugo laibachii Nc14]